MKFYTNDNELYVCHFPGKGKTYYMDLFKDMENFKFNISNDITIISLMNKPCYETSLLVKQLNNNNITFLNSEIAWNTEPENWSNAYRINLLVDVLKTVTTKYCLIMDGNDTIITKDLDESFIEKFKSKNCNVLFNYTESLCPTHLNAGVCIGYTESLLELYVKLSKKMVLFRNIPYDDQAFLSYLTKNDETIKLDDNKEMFGVFHKVFYELATTVDFIDGDAYLNEYRKDEQYLIR